MRIGMGYDMHRIDANRPLWLGGLEIPGAPGLAGHSDADVLLHAITDALLGAIGEPNLGELFPNTDARYRDCASRVFVEEAYRRVQAQGYTIANMDTVVVAEHPKLAPHRTAMIARIQALLQLTAGQVNVKATTAEGLGAIGRGEGMAVHAVVLLERKEMR
jgi:2-C-methyl-D-erythritol 2,4-cyclodiphosphate synthase